MLGSGVYLITNKITEKVYIGSSVDIRRRWNQHRSYLRNNKHPNKKLQNSWNKHGENAFIFKVLCSVDDPNTLHVFEQFWINVYDSKDSGYNLAEVAGSNLGMRHTDEAKAKISAASKGRKMSDEWKAKISLANSSPRGPMSEATKEKLRAAHTGKKHTEEAKAKMRGRKLSAETLAKRAATLALNKAKRQEEVSSVREDEGSLEPV